MNPKLADDFLALAQAGSCLVWRRHEVAAEAMELQFTCLGDTRPPLDGDDARVERVVDRVHKSTECCSNRFALTVKKRSGSAEDLRKPKWKLVALLWSKLLEYGLSIGDVERGHKLTNSLVTGKLSSLESVMARHINIDAKMELESVKLHARRIQACQAIEDGVAVTNADPICHAIVPVTESPPPSTKVRRRAQNPLWHFRKNLPDDVLVNVMQLLGHGRKANRFTTEFHKAVASAFASLPPERVMVYENLALIDKLRVQAVKKSAKAASHLAPPGPLPLPPAPSHPAPVPLAPALQPPVPILDAETPEAPQVDAIVPVVSADIVVSHCDPRCQIARLNPEENHVLSQLVLPSRCRACRCPPQAHALLDGVSLASQLALPPTVDHDMGSMTLAKYVHKSEVSGEPLQPLHLAVYETHRGTNSKASMRESFKAWTGFVAKNKKLCLMWCGTRRCVTHVSVLLPTSVTLRSRPYSIAAWAFFQILSLNSNALASRIHESHLLQN